MVGYEPVMSLTGADPKPGGKVIRGEVNKIAASAICYFSPGTLL